MRKARMRQFLLRLVDTWFPPEMLGPVVYLSDEPPIADDDTQPSVRLVGDWHRPCHTPNDDNGWRIVE